MGTIFPRKPVTKVNTVVNVMTGVMWKHCLFSSIIRHKLVVQYFGYGDSYSTAMSLKLN